VISSSFWTRVERSLSYRDGLAALEQPLLRQSVAVDCQIPTQMAMELWIAMMRVRWMRTRLHQVFADVAPQMWTAILTALQTALTSAHPIPTKQYKVFASASTG
jgi:hypothetical protein